MIAGGHGRPAFAPAIMDSVPQMPDQQTRNAVTAVQTAVTALGNPALTHHNPIERHLRDVLCCRIHPPQDDMALIILGKKSLGL